MIVAAAVAMAAGAWGAAADPVVAPAALGQWVWSRADVPIFERTRAVVPALEGAVFVATIAAAPDGLAVRFALPPTAAGPSPSAIVVRFDAGIHALWDAHDDEWMATNASGVLATVMGRVAQAGGGAAAIQLDYDCPVRQLSRWATVVGALRMPGAALAGRSLWITSLPAHLRRADYGTLFRGVVAGHVVQVFDSGEAPDLETLTADLARHTMPFRVGIGAFERGTGGGDTDHRRWFAAVPRFAASSWYRGVWVFPGGRAWLAAWRQAR